MDRLIIMLHSLRALRSRGAHNVKTPPNRASRTSDEASYVDNAAPTPLNMSPRPTSRVEERTVPSVDDGCYTCDMEGRQDSGHTAGQRGGGAKG